jgi:hypothetical protein
MLHHPHRTNPVPAAADPIAYIAAAASGWHGMQRLAARGNTKVRGGAVSTRAKLPFTKVQEKVVAANMQNGSRGSA